jgi:thiamine biosynthesis lipoprotein
MTAARFAESTWRLWSTSAHLLVTDAGAHSDAERLVKSELASIESACSRFRSDSEVSALTTAHGRPTEVTPLLAYFVGAALQAAALTGGAVDPTVGSALIACGYDRDFADLRTDTGGVSSTVSEIAVVRRADWTMVSLDDCMLTVPDGVVLDLGATAKAVAADRCAALVSATFGCGVLISLGGDIATSGQTPDGGWHIRVCDGDDEPSTTITVDSGVGIATSSTLRRRWVNSGQHLHHILDPKTGWPVEPYWRTVTVAAETSLLANTASTACIVKGRGALSWLEQVGLPARLVRSDGVVTRVGNWPAESVAA